MSQEAKPKTRKSCILNMRKSGIKSFDTEATQTADLSFDELNKNKFARRLSGIGTVSNGCLALFQKQKFIWMKQDEKKQNQQPNSKKLNQYDFLRNKEQIQFDPFLKAKMKYLVNKEKPLLYNEISKLRILPSQKKNTQNIEIDSSDFTTLKKQNKKEYNRKVLLLHLTDSKVCKPKN